MHTSLSFNTVMTVRLSRLLYDFTNSIPDPTNTDGEGVLVNKFDLLCPRANCGSIILKKGVGMCGLNGLVFRLVGISPWYDKLPTGLLVATPEPSNPSRPPASPSAIRNRSMVANHWITHVNVGCTHPVQPLTTSGKSLFSNFVTKCLRIVVLHSLQGSGSNFSPVLCDLGPLGWSEGGSEYWLASRVGYGAPIHIIKVDVHYNIPVPKIHMHARFFQMMIKTSSISWTCILTQNQFN